MCGKFTAMASWAEVHAFSQPLTMPADGSEGDSSNDQVVTYGVARNVPVIISENGQRRIVMMRWGFPHAKDWRRPQPIHARSETIDTTQAFADAFHDGQRGIVVMRTFNEGEEVGSKTVQYTIDPGDGIPRGFAFLWRRFEIEGLPVAMLACVMVTAPASNLIAPITDRMPAILEDADWATWLGETAAPPAEAKATLRTMEGVNWKMAKEPKPESPKERNTTKARPKPPPEPTMF
jgi:putative SOS response-associated peptidase YedK